MHECSKKVGQDDQLRNIRIRKEKRRKSKVESKGAMRINA
jgi:hypothetical protein